MELPDEYKSLEIRDIFERAVAEETLGYDAPSAMVILMHIMDGCNLTMAIDRHNEAHPDRRVTRLLFRKWRVYNPELQRLYDLAIGERAHAFMEDIIEIADDATDDATMGAQGPIINGKAIRRAELMIKTRQWAMGKAKPEAYGDKTQMELTGKDGKDLVPTTFNIGLVPKGHFVVKAEEEEVVEPEETIPEPE